MVLDGLFNALGFNADIALCDGGAAVLQEPLYQGNIISVLFVNLRGVPFAEAVGADAVIAQVVADYAELLLHGSFCEREYPISEPDAVPETVVFYVLLDDERDSKHTPFAGLLFNDLQAVTVTVPDNITRAKSEYIADAQAQVALQHQGGGDALVWAASAEAFFHCLDDLFVLLCGERDRLLVHGLLLKSSYLSAGKVLIIVDASSFGRDYWFLVFVFVELYEQICMTGFTVI